MPLKLVAESDKLVQALYDHGVIAEDYQKIRRVVIDLEVGHIARVYVDRYADADALEAGLLAGMVITTEAEAGKVGRLIGKDER